MQKFGVSPAQIVDYLSLTGDAVDNVPGVDKVISGYAGGDAKTCDALLAACGEPPPDEKAPPK